MEFKNENQLKAFLKNESKRLDISIPHVYSTYFSRKLLERLASRNYGKFIVKGSFSQYVHMRKLVRPVTDIDLASADSYSESLEPLFNNINDDSSPIKFKLNNIKTTRTGIKKLRISAEAFNKLNQPINIDFDGQNTRVYEVNYKQVVPIFKDDNMFFINTPSFEEHIAEKLCIVAESNKPDILNTRVKDFYDLYEMHGGLYDRDKFELYFERMLKDRGKIKLCDLTTVFLNKSYVERHQALWDSMKGKDKYEFLDNDIDFDEAVFYTRAILSEEIQKIREHSIEKTLIMK